MAGPTNMPGAADKSLSGDCSPVTRTSPHHHSALTDSSPHPRPPHQGTGAEADRQQRKSGPRRIINSNSSGIVDGNHANPFDDDRFERPALKDDASARRRVFDTRNTDNCPADNESSDNQDGDNTQGDTRRADKEAFDNKLVDNQPSDNRSPDNAVADTGPTDIKRIDIKPVDLGRESLANGRGGAVQAASVANAGDGGAIAPGSQRDDVVLVRAQLAGLGVVTPTLDRLVAEFPADEIQLRVRDWHIRTQAGAKLGLPWLIASIRGRYALHKSTLHLLDQQSRSAIAQSQRRAQRERLSTEQASQLAIATRAEELLSSLNDEELAQVKEQVMQEFPGLVSETDDPRTTRRLRLLVLAKLASRLPRDTH